MNLLIRRVGFGLNFILMWIINDNKTLAMSMLPKNGTHTLSNFFKGRRVSNDVVVKCPRRIVWLRNPWDRLISAFSFFKVKLENGQFHGRPYIDEVKDWETWIDFILSGAVSDPHWNSQVKQLTFMDEFLGTEVYKFDNLHKHWNRLFNGMLPHLNGCVHNAVNISYRQSDILKKYHKDFNLYFSLED